MANPRLLKMAGFQLIIHGWFWVIGDSHLDLLFSICCCALLVFTGTCEIRQPVPDHRHGV